MMKKGCVQDMPFITVKVLEGKSVEQKRQLIERMTRGSL